MPTGAFIESPSFIIRKELCKAAYEWYYPIIRSGQELSGARVPILDANQDGLHPVSVVCHEENSTFSVDTSNKRSREYKVTFTKSVKLIMEFETEVDLFEWEQYLGSEDFLTREFGSGDTDVYFAVTPILEGAIYDHPTREPGSGTEVAYSFRLVMSRK